MSSGDRTLLVRADGGRSIGSGHVMRSLALIHAWQDAGGRAVLAAHELPAFFHARRDVEDLPTIDVAAQPGSERDAETTVQTARDIGAEWVVIDGYHFGEDFRKRLREAGLRVVIVDDEGRREHVTANILLNPNLHAGPSMYPSTDPDAQLLLGPRYALLRREFWSISRATREYREIATRLLILLGGSDTHKFAAWLVDTLAMVCSDETRFDLVSSLTDEERSDISRRASGRTGEIGIASSVQDMPDLMSRADLAISAGGSTCWELAFLGTPALVVALADNQRAVTRSLHHAGVALDLGWFEDLRPEPLCAAIRKLGRSSRMRRQLGEAGRALVDGQGGHRVVMAMGGDPIRLRRVDAQDMELLWTWVNDPEVRASALSTEPISLETHRAWFQRQLADAETSMFIAVDGNDQPVGQARFNTTGPGESTVSLSIVEGERGRGLGWQLIQMASRRELRLGRNTRIHAVVKVENVRSMHAFARAGFRLESHEVIDGVAVAHWALDRES